MRVIGLDDCLPQHIAIVMDGNGRWAEKHHRLRLEGHRAGLESTRTVIRCCIQRKIPVLSLFAFSSENWNRPEPEVQFLMALFLEALKDEIRTLNKEKVRVQFIGNNAALNARLREEIQAAENLTANNQGLILNIAINYGGVWDILQAVRSLANKAVAGEILPEAIDEQALTAQLRTGSLPAPDLFIRTSGEQRISNFFLWQLAYTELYFSDLFWPEFNEEAFQAALDDFSQRQRRYGRL